MASYTAISDHGVIGDLRTAALVGADGRIDWMCAPRFDSPSVFGALLDAERGGHWTICPSEPGARSAQFYSPDSNVLITRFMGESGMVEVRDFMPILKAHDADHRQRVVRQVVAVRGSMSLRMELAARFDYGRAEHQIHGSGTNLVLVSETCSLRLGSGVEVDVDDGDLSCAFDLAVGETVTFVLEVLPGGETGGETGGAGEVPARADADSDADSLMMATIRFWRDWLAGSRYTGRWRETVHRAALTLKLLTHEPTGAIVAAPTAGLPEVIGGERNWDYRYVWIRDAAFSLYALLRLGFMDEATAFMAWLTDRFADCDDGSEGPLRLVYDIDGNPAPAEVELDHWEGHRGSRPVRIGNAAVDQLQLDIYGELIDSIYLFNKYGPGISLDQWRDLRRVVDWLQKNWNRPDEGIWEARSERRNHSYSRLMCWVAMERMIRMARLRGLPGDVGDWAATRDAIHEDLLENGWSEQKQAFVQDYETDVADASLLLMTMVKFAAPNDPRFASTLAAIEKSLVTDALVFRYANGDSPDGVTGEEGTFTMCSFWLVEAYTRAGRHAEAQLALEKMFTYANRLGLYAEEIGRTGEQLGNFPQALTHLSLISAAINLDRALG